MISLHLSCLRKIFVYFPFLTLKDLSRSRLSRNMKYLFASESYIGINGVDETRVRSMRVRVRIRFARENPLSIYNEARGLCVKSSLTPCGETTGSVACDKDDAGPGFKIPNMRICA